MRLARVAPVASENLRNDFLGTRRHGGGSVAAPRVDDLSGGVGGGEGGFGGGQLGDEAVEDVFEVAEGACDFGGDSFGDGDAARNGGARDAESGSLGRRWRIGAR